MRKYGKCQPSAPSTACSVKSDFKHGAGGYDYFLLLIGNSSIWFTEKHFFKTSKYVFLTH